MFDPLAPQYSAVEIAIAILLAALPMSQIANILLGVFQRKTGITLDRNKATTEDNQDQ